MDAAVTGKLATVFGGSGFVGRHLVQALARRGWRVRVAVRRPDLAGHVVTQGSVGQVQPVQANLRYRESVERAVEGADAVINLVGILYETRRQSFTAVHEEGARTVAEATAAAGCGQLVQMSALAANSQSASSYARSKAAGEAAVRAALSNATIVRPSVIFGPQDGFFNRFAAIARLSPVLPLIGGGQTRFQPIYVGDVAQVLALAAEGRVGPAQTYELGGPDILTFKQCLEIMLQVIGRERILVPLPFFIARIDAWFLQILPKPLLTVDQVRLLESDAIVSQAAIDAGRTLEGLGLSGQGLAATLPTYLDRFRVHGQFEKPHRA